MTLSRKLQLGLRPFSFLLALTFAAAQVSAGVAADNTLAQSPGAGSAWTPDSPNSSGYSTPTSPPPASLNSSTPSSPSSPPAQLQTQYGSVETNDMPVPSFRLKRPASPIRSTPQLTQPADSVPPVVNPELNQLFPADQFQQGSVNQTGTPPVTRSSTTWRPGVILTGSLGEKSLTATCDLGMAAQQAQENPTSPEAAFIYAVALTKTTEVERALKEVRRARNLAQATGDPNYFNRAVGEYEDTLKAEPQNTCIRYGLGWAYYMEAYLVAERARKAQQQQEILAGHMPQKKSKLEGGLMGGASILASVLTGTRVDTSALPHIPGALENVPPSAVPAIKVWYQKCLDALDGVVARDPKDTWAAVYSAHVREEYDGNHDVALKKLESLKNTHPDNPAAAFFLADAYARSGKIMAGASSLGSALRMKMQGK